MELAYLGGDRNLWSGGGWKEYRLVDRHRFPKGITSISHGPEEGQKLFQGSKYLNKLLGLMEQAISPSVRRGDYQNTLLAEQTGNSHLLTVPSLYHWSGG